MDRICNAVLEKTNQSAYPGRYVVISEDEFLEAFPEGEQKSGELLMRALKFLQVEGYIDLKYSHGNMFCVAPLKKCEPAPQENAQAAAALTPPPAQSRNKQVIPPLIAAFCGGAAGSLIISLIFLLINA